jgi:hypothetical protein
MTKPTLRMWAVIVKSRRTEWIYWPSIDRTRAGAIKLYGKDYSNPNIYNEHRRKNQVRTARVIVTEA